MQRVPLVVPDGMDEVVCAAHLPRTKQQVSAQGSNAPKIGPLGGALGPFAGSNTIFEEEVAEDGEDPEDPEDPSIR